jgi:hypothetical protein
MGLHNIVHRGSPRSATCRGGEVIMYFLSTNVYLVGCVGECDKVEINLKILRARIDYMII